MLGRDVGTWTRKNGYRGTEEAWSWDQEHDKKKMGRQTQEGAGDASTAT